MAVDASGIPPILTQRHYTQLWAFAPENLRREASGQERIMGTRIRDIIVRDSDGDIVRCDGLRSRPLP
jgi:hypothetical protein